MRHVWNCWLLVEYQGARDVRTERVTEWRTWCLSSEVRDDREWHLRGWSGQKERCFLVQFTFGEGHRRWEFQGLW